jgi:hypothetical protein
MSCHASVMKVSIYLQGNDGLAGRQLAESSRRGKVAGAKAPLISEELRRPEGRLFHGDADIPRQERERRQRTRTGAEAEGKNGSGGRGQERELAAGRRVRVEMTSSSGEYEQVLDQCASTELRPAGPMNTSVPTLEQDHKNEVIRTKSRAVGRSVRPKRGRALQKRATKIKRAAVLALRGFPDIDSQASA